MKKIKNFIFKIIVLISIITFNGCKEDDKPTNNSGSIIFWQTKATSDKNYPKTFNYKVYIKNQLVDYIVVKNYWNQAPECGADNTITYVHQLGEKTEESLYFEIRDDVDDILLDGNLTIKNGVCSNYEIK